MLVIVPGAFVCMEAWKVVEGDINVWKLLKK